MTIIQYEHIHTESGSLSFLNGTTYEKIFEKTNKLYLR
ncbi:hypothetical protein LEP1GSC124_0005 [Leptospira interrogans serovar Pyrogenes str. 200701872]|uniref:Uncharacterized protein n=1 Tax=Leptospira interrogans serovar Pyrogenes str. 200701872 TaxID=1193029 RepID=M6ZHB4_LEPIR|nr:hypothetical protein LEP1GSC124_0005 [Leptospira interrogans serovar Pyrogenes str. 200701872]